MFKWFVSFWSRTSNDSILTMVLATQDLPKNMNLRLYCASLDLLARLGWQKLKIFIFQKFLKKWNFHLSSSTSTGKSYAELKIKGPSLAKILNFQIFIFTQNLVITRHAKHHRTFISRNRKCGCDLYPFDQGSLTIHFGPLS